MKIERELKYILSKNDFCKLSSYLNEYGEFVGKEFNENYYIDSENIDLSDLSIRLRCISNESFEFTVKVRKNSNFDQLHIKEEYTKYIDKPLFEKTLSMERIKKENILLNNMDNIKEILVVKNIEELFVLEGMLKTKRIKYRVSSPVIEFTLDESNYFNTRDYELEIELDEGKVDETIEFLLNLFEILNIEPEKSINSKTKRFKKIYLQNRDGGKVVSKENY